MTMPMNLHRLNPILYTFNKEIKGIEEFEKEYS